MYIENKSSVVYIYILYIYLYIFPCVTVVAQWAKAPGIQNYCTPWLEPCKDIIS